MRDPATRARIWQRSKEVLMILTGWMVIFLPLSGWDLRIVLIGVAVGVPYLALHTAVVLAQHRWGTHEAIDGEDKD